MTHSVQAPQQARFGLPHMQALCTQLQPENPNIIVLPPCVDQNPQHMQPTLTDVLREVAKNDRDKTLLIAVALNGMSKHWVLVEITANKATIYDSKSRWFARLFNSYKPIEEAVFNVLGTRTESICTGFQAWSNDHSCGPHVASALKTRSEGKALTEPSALELQDWREKAHTHAALTPYTTTWQRHRTVILAAAAVTVLAIGIAALACSPGGALLLLAAVSKLALTSTVAKITFFGASTAFAGAAIAMNIKQRHDQNKCQPFEVKRLIINSTDSDLIDQEFQL